VLTKDDYSAIRRAHCDGKSIRQIARASHVSRRKIREALASAEPRPYTRTKPRPAPVLGPFTAIIERILLDDRDSQPKRRHTAMQVYRCLRDEHFYPGGYAQVQRFLFRHRRRHQGTFSSKATATVPFTEGQERTPQQKAKADHQWMLRALQGKEPLDSIRRAAADTKEFDKLVTNLFNGNLKYRNKSLTIIAKSNGISISSISRFLHITRKTARRYWNTYRIYGRGKLFKGFYHKALKSDDEQLVNLLFSILHAPPSDFDINRTTWIMRDLRRVLREKGHKASSKVIRTIVRFAGYRWKNARKVLTSNDPRYREKLERIQSILSILGPSERFFSIDEYGPFAVKMQGGRSLVPPGVVRTVPQRQRSKGSLILTAALELSTNQVTHFYSEKKNTAEMIKLLDVLLVQYAECDKIYFSWDAASWHASKALNKRVDEVNSPEYKVQHRCPLVELVPLPSCAQFLNVIEAVFSGMAKAIMHNSDYESLEACKAAIDRHFLERNAFFKANPKRAGKIIWGKESIPSKFSPSNNCKNPKYLFLGF
jgi:transposase